MKLTTIGKVFAERKLRLSPRGEVIVRIGKPQKFRGFDDYFCPFEIHWPDKRSIFYSGGVDSVQALYLAMQMIGTRLYTSVYARNGEMTWVGKRNLGFPVPSNVLDLIPNEKPRKPAKRSATRSTSQKKSLRG